MPRHTRFIAVIITAVLPLVGCSIPGGTPTDANPAGAYHLTNTLTIKTSQPVVSVALGRLRGQDVIVSGTDNCTIQVWDAKGDPVGEPLNTPVDEDGHSFVSVAIGHLNGKDVIVAGCDDWVRIWDAGLHLAGELTDGSAPVALGRMNGRDVIVSGGSTWPDFTVRVWDADGNPIVHTPQQSDCKPIPVGPLISVAIGQLNGQDIVVSTWVCGFGPTDYPEYVLQVWDPQGHPVGPRTSGQIEAAAGQLNGKGVVAVVVEDGVQILDAPGQPAGPSIVVPTSRIGNHAVMSLVIGRFVGQDVLASVTSDGDILIWDGHRQVIAQGSTDMEEPLQSVAIGQLNSKDTVVTGSEDSADTGTSGVVRVWQITDDRA